MRPSNALTAILGLCMALAANSAPMAEPNDDRMSIFYIFPSSVDENVHRTQKELGSELHTIYKH